MEIQEAREGDVLVLSPMGRLDTTTSRDFESRVLELLGNGNVHYVVDFANIEYVSSAGLRVLLMLGKRLPGVKGSLVLCGLSTSVMEVFDIAGFSRIFNIVPGRDKALADVEKIRQGKVAPQAAAKDRRAARRRGRTGTVKSSDVEAAVEAGSAPAPEPAPAAKAAAGDGEPAKPEKVSIEDVALRLLRGQKPPPFLEKLEKEAKDD